MKTNKKQEKSEYSKLLQDPRWQKKRLEILQRDNWTCRNCGSGLNEGVTLHVHHIRYIKGKKPWEYENDNLITYCENCHQKIHSEKKQNKKNECRNKIVFYRFLLNWQGKLTQNESIVYSFLLQKSIYSKEENVFADKDNLALYNISFRKIAKELGMSLSTVNNSIKHLKKHKLIGDKWIYSCEEITSKGYFTLRMDLMEEINGKLLVFYSWLCDRSKNGYVDAYRGVMARFFNDKESNIHNMLQRLHGLNYISREVKEDGCYGKLKLLK